MGWHGRCSLLESARREGSREAHAEPCAAWETFAVEKRILVVDHHRPSREGLRDWLRTEGHKIETAADSRQAIRQVGEGHFDIAIIDLDLPPVDGVTMSGWELACVLRVHHPAMSLILIGTEDAEAAGMAAAGIRASQFLEKPISPARLKTLVRTLDP